ncbi:hypothetical protein BDQ17DRAFT_512367 [Cyathus striatus]|nr:hypothetical protein BDQ17DRAFT_512367 [Cyathus striatus]
MPQPPIHPPIHQLYPTEMQPLPNSPQFGPLRLSQAMKQLMGECEVFPRKENKSEPAGEPKAPEVEVKAEKSNTEAEPKQPESKQQGRRPEGSGSYKDYMVNQLRLPEDYFGDKIPKIRIKKSFEDIGLPPFMPPLIPFPSHNIGIPVKNKEDELADKLAALEKRLNEEQLRRRFEDLEVRVEGVENEKARKLKKRVRALEKLVKELESRVACLEEESLESADEVEEVDEESDDGGWGTVRLMRLTRGISR